MRPIDLGLPSGVRWAPFNVDVRNAGGFATSAAQYDCSFFSWGNTESHVPTSEHEFSYNWGDSIEGPYATTPGAAIEYPGSISLENDPARIYCGGLWRMPTKIELEELLNNVEFIDDEGVVIQGSNKLTEYNGVVGLLMRSVINGARIFFPCSGYGTNQLWRSRGTSGLYWSVDLYGATNAYVMIFLATSVSNPLSNRLRCNGFPIRPVWSE